MLTSSEASVTVLSMSTLLLSEVSPVLVILFAVPALVWSWGRAIEQLAIGLERMGEVSCRRHEPRSETRAAGVSLARRSVERVAGLRGCDHPDGRD